jgi:hypothetical protein
MAHKKAAAATPGSKTNPRKWLAAGMWSSVLSQPMARRLVCVVLIALVPVFLPRRGDAEAVYRTKKYVEQISADPLPSFFGSQVDVESEPHIAADPNDPSVLVAVVHQGRPPLGGAQAIGYATSHDGGKTWTTGVLPVTTAGGGPFFAAADPVVAFGPDGAVYAQSIAYYRTTSPCRHAVAVTRSDDGGLTFGLPFLAVEANCTSDIRPDKDWIAVDTFPANPHYGRIYSVWDTDRHNLAYSDDRGESWSAPVDSHGQGADLPVVQPNGALTVIARDFSATSHDGGATFDAFVPHDSVMYGFPPSHIVGATVGLHAATVDPVTGQLYQVWQDGRFRQFLLNDIVMIRSTDGGASWSAPRVVNPGSGRDRWNRFTPAVAAYGGFVHVAYRAVRQEPSIGMRYVVSSDGGDTFGAERRLGRPGDIRFAQGPSLAGSFFMGDYMGLVAGADAAHAVWCLPLRSPSPPHQTTWSATLRR